MGDQSCDGAVDAWCVQHGMNKETARVLREEGFCTVEHLYLLTPEEVDRSFRAARLLPMAQCLLLKQAVDPLKGSQQLGRSGYRQAQSQSTAGSSQRESSQAAQNSVSTVLDVSKLSVSPEAVSPETSSNSDGNRTINYAPFPSFIPRGFKNWVNVDVSQCPPDAEDVLRFLLVGKTGSGKSTTGNSILGSKTFSTDLSFDSQTTSCQIGRQIVCGTMIEIMDSPGLFDTKKTHEEISADIVKAVGCMHPGPHAVLYVIRIGRYTHEDHEVYRRFKVLFDDNVTRHLIVIFTGGDVLENQHLTLESVLQTAPANLHTVLQECQHRVVVFNNLAQDKAPYVQQLKQAAEQLLVANSGHYYTCPKYAHIGQGVEQEVKRRLGQMEQEQLARKPYVQELRKKTEDAEKTLQEQRKLFQEREKERLLNLNALRDKAKVEMDGLEKLMKERQDDMEHQQEQIRQLKKKQESENRKYEREAEKQRQLEQEKLDLVEQEWKQSTKTVHEEESAIQRLIKRNYELQVAMVKDHIATNNGNFFSDLMESLASVCLKWLKTKENSM